MKHLYVILLYLAGNNPFFSFATVAGGGDHLIKSGRIVNGKPPRVKIPARWKKVNDEVVGHIPRTQLVRMRASVEALQGFLEDSCLAATGLNPTWRGIYSIQKMGNGIQLRFGIECQFPTGDSMATLRIVANDLTPLFSRLTVNHQDFLTLPSVPVVRDGCSNFEADDPTAGTHRDLLLVTASSDELPYIPVTRKEYLLIVQADLNAMRENTVAAVKERTPIRPAALQAASKQQDLKTLEAQYSGAELDMRKKLYVERYTTDEDYQKACIDKATADVDSTIQLVGALLHHLSATALEAPAVVSPNSSRFEGFRDGEPGMVMLVRLNTAFTDAAAEPGKPRTFLIYWDRNSADANAAATFRLILENIDMCMLQRMIKGQGPI